MSNESFLNVHVKLFVRDLLCTKKIPDSYGFKYKSIIIDEASVMGVVTKIFRFDKGIRYSVDDGSGVITCVHYYNGDPDICQTKEQPKIRPTLPEIQGQSDELLGSYKNR